MAYRDPNMKRDKTEGKSLLYSRIACGIIFLCIILRLFPSAADGREKVLRDPFLLAHTLDPSYGPDSNYHTWNRSQWLRWRGARDPLHEAAKPDRRSRLDEKGINTVMIASPSEVEAAFQGPLDRWGEHSWSNRAFVTFEFARNNDGSFTIFRCPPTFIAVKLINGKPVHLAGHLDVKKTAGNINFSRPQKCREVTK